MQNKTVMKMAIALLRGDPFVEEVRQKKCSYSKRDEPENKVVKQLPVSSRACGGSITLVDDAMYANDAWTMQARVHRHAVKRDKLLAVITPDFAYSQFTGDAKQACEEMKVPYVGVRPDLPHSQAREYFDFAVWRIVQDAVNARDPELEQNRLLERAGRVVQERSLYALFFGLKWPSVMAAAPADLRDLEATLTRKRVEGPKQPLPEWRQLRAAQRGVVTPFWLGADFK